MSALGSRHPGLEVKDAHEIETSSARTNLRRARAVAPPPPRSARRDIARRCSSRALARVRTAGRRGVTRSHDSVERGAYGSIVGAGANGTQLHYMKTGRAIARRSRVIDAAPSSRVRGDVTRTIPVSAKYTRSSAPSISSCASAGRGGAQLETGHVRRPRRFVGRRPDSRLAAFGLVQSADATFDPPWAWTARASEYLPQRFWMIHGISHGMVLPCTIRRSSTSAIGRSSRHAFTIEPGIYISAPCSTRSRTRPKNARSSRRCGRRRAL